MDLLVITIIIFIVTFAIFGVVDMLNQTKNIKETQVKKKPNPKQFDGIKSEQPFVKTRKRKPKTVKDWEDEFDIGGNS